MTSSTHTTYQDVDTGIDLVVAAVAGDKLEIGASLRWNNESTVKLLDVATIVSGSPVNYCSGLGASGNGVIAWIGENAVAGSAGGSIIYTVVSGDISGGTVTLRPRLRANTNTAITLRANATTPFHWHVKNLKQ